MFRRDFKKLTFLFQKTVNLQLFTPQNSFNAQNIPEK